MKPYRVVLDTNVLISAIVFGGKPKKVLQAAIAGTFQLVLSNTLLEELHGVLEGPKFKLPREMMKTVRDELLLFADLVVPMNKLDVIVSDPDDNRVLECAATGEVDFIVSGDPDLLDLGQFQNIRIWTPAQFVREILDVR